jgi:ABC-2 type transport system permease protein
MSINVNQIGVNMIAGAHVMVVALLAMLSNISSASAVSRDGENFYTSKIIPVNYYSQIFAKFSFNAVFTFGSLIVTAIVSSFVYPIWQVLLGTLAIAMASAGHIALCINLDIKNPTASLQGNENASTVGKNTTRCLIYGLLIGFALGLLMMLMSSAENIVVPYLIITALSLVFMIYNVNNLILRINLAYEKIEL